MNYSKNNFYRRLIFVLGAQVCALLLMPVALQAVEPGSTAADSTGFGNSFDYPPQNSSSNLMPGSPGSNDPLNLGLAYGPARSSLEPTLLPPDELTRQQAGTMGQDTSNSSCPSPDENK